MNVNTHSPSLSPPVDSYGGWQVFGRRARCFWRPPALLHVHTGMGRSCSNPGQYLPSTTGTWRTRMMPTFTCQVPGPGEMVTRVSALAYVMWMVPLLSVSGRETVGWTRVMALPESRRAWWDLPDRPLWGPVGDCLMNQADVLTWGFGGHGLVYGLGGCCPTHWS